MARPACYLGVDGGGTKTDFLLIGPDRKTLASHRATTAYHLQVGLDGVRTVLSEGIDAICEAAGIGRDDLTHTFFGLPAFGEDRVTDPKIESICRDILGHDRFTCGNDMICGWAGSLDCADGINLVAGTGSIAYGERQGHGARCGGWGEVFSDEGSAYWIAREGLNAFSRMSDGRVPKGVLYDHFRNALSLDDDIDLCARVMGEDGMPRDELAALSMVVSQAAAAGDAMSTAILERAADELAAMAFALRQTLQFSEHELTPVSWSGGVVTRISAVRDGLLKRLQDAGGFRAVEPLHSPAVGAALYAMHVASSR